MGIMSEATESLDSSIGSSGGCAGTTGASSRSMCRALVRSVGLSVFSNSSLRVFRPATASPCPTAGMPAVDFGAVGQHSCDPIRPVLIFGLAWRCDTVFGPGNRQSHHEWWSQQPLDGIVSSGSLCHCRPRSNSLAPANPPTGEGGDRGCTPSLGGLLSGPWPRQDQQRTEAMEHGDQLEALLFGGLDVACPVVTRSAVPLVLVQVAAAHPAEAPSEAPAGGLLGFLGFLVFRFLGFLASRLLVTSWLGV